ncbi:DMT family transporter [Paenibacillus terrigena]|uniref:DMT family transporter n=1 Tax=Paenibacillus terrigena TaxID=369333 RepID=UPI000369B2E5|nr:EamA family transporter [Paenibacillus terrigena]
MNKGLIAICILLTTVVGGLNYTMAKLGLHVASPFLLLAIRFIGSGLLLLPFVIRRRHPRAAKQWLQVAGVSLFQTILVMTFIYLSLHTISASTSAILSSTNPIWTILFAFLFFGARYRVVQWAGVVIGFMGVIVTQNFNMQMNEGTIYALLAGVFWGFGTLVASRWSKAMDTWVLTAYQMLFAGIVLLLASLTLEQPYLHLTSNGNSWGLTLTVLIWMICFSSIFQFLPWFYVLKHYSPSKASTFMFLVPLFGILSGALILGETIHWYVIAGGLCTGIGITLVNRPAKPVRDALKLGSSGQAKGKINGVYCFVRE